MRDVFILDAVRTPRGRGKAGKGALSGLHPQELLAQALNHLARRSGLDTADVEDVVVGCVSQVNEQGANIARNSVLTAGWPDTATGVTLNRFCGSGAQAFNFAAMGVMSGQQDLVVAGGVESMSRVPMGSDGGSIDGNNMNLRKRLTQVPQGISADLIATVEGFGREELDRLAVDSQARAAAAIGEGRGGAELAPVRVVPRERGESTDERRVSPRASRRASSQTSGGIAGDALRKADPRSVSQRDSAWH